VGRCSGLNKGPFQGQIHKGQGTAVARTISTKFFTSIEVQRRLRSAKDYLAKHKNQRVKFLAPIDKNLPTLTLDYYDSEDEYNFVCASPLEREHIEKVVALNSSMFKNNDLYDYYSLGEYVDQFCASLQQLFSFTCMHFVDKNEKVLFKCVVCLGSLHHAPRLLFYDTSKKELIYEKLMAYDDLQ
jgi:hypothetical protein